MQKKIEFVIILSHFFSFSVLMRIFGVHPDLKLYTGNVSIMSLHMYNDYFLP